MLKRRKRDEAWAVAKAAEASAAKTKAKTDRAEIFKRAETYAKEYLKTEQDTIRLKRVAKAKGGFFVEPEAKLAFVIRLRGINDMDPQTKKILQLLRLRQINNGVFIKITKATLMMLRRVEPYIMWGYPNLKSVKELVYKRGYGKVRDEFLAWAEGSHAPDTRRWLEQARAVYGQRGDRAPGRHAQTSARLPETR